MTRIKFVDFAKDRAEPKNLRMAMFCLPL